MFWYMDGGEWALLFVGSAVLFVIYFAFARAFRIRRWVLFGLGLTAVTLVGTLGLMHLQLGDIPGHHIWPELGNCHICEVPMYAWQSTELREFDVTVTDENGNEVHITNPTIQMFGPVHAECEGHPAHKPTVTFEPSS